MGATKKEKALWKERIGKFHEGDTFEYKQKGWKTISPLYANDEVAIIIKVGQKGELGCCSCHEINWFGKESNCNHPFRLNYVV